MDEHNRQYEGSKDIWCHREDLACPLQALIEVAADLRLHPKSRLVQDTQSIIRLVGCGVMR